MKNKFVTSLIVLLFCVLFSSCVVDNPNFNYHAYQPVEHRHYWGHPSSYRGYNHHFGHRHGWQRR